MKRGRAENRCWSQWPRLTVWPARASSGQRFPGVQARPIRSTGKVGTDTRRWTYSFNVSLHRILDEAGLFRGEKIEEKRKTRGKWRPLIKSFLPDIVIVPSPSRLDVRLIMASSIKPRENQKPISVRIEHKWKGERRERREGREEEKGGRGKCEGIPSMVLKKYNPPHGLSVNFKTFVYSRLVRQAGIEENEKKRKEAASIKRSGRPFAVTPIDASRVSSLSVLDSRFGSWKKVCGGGCKPEDGFEGCERVVRGLYPANGTLGVFPENPLVFII